MAGDFYARNSWDYRLVKPLIEEYLLGDRYPQVISDTVIYDHIQQEGVARFGANRLFHCISRVLKELGYQRRSRRGRTWDLVGDLNINSRISSPAYPGRHLPQTPPFLPMLPKIDCNNGQ